MSYLHESAGEDANVNFSHLFLTPHSACSQLENITKKQLSFHSQEYPLTMLGKLKSLQASVIS